MWHLFVSFILFYNTGDKILHERNIPTRIKNFSELLVEVWQHSQSRRWCRCSEVAVLWHSLMTADSSCRQHLLFDLCWLVSHPPGGYALYPTKPVRPGPPLTAIFPHRGSDHTRRNGLHLSPVFRNPRASTRACLSLHLDLRWTELSPH